MIKFACSKCAQAYRVSDEYAGKRVRCKACNNVNVIPSPEIVKSDIEDSLAAYNNLLLELSKIEKQAPTVDLES